MFENQKVRYTFLSVQINNIGHYNLLLLTMATAVSSSMFSAFSTHNITLVLKRSKHYN